ncbi:hypothetical protein LDY77_24955, partial [Serratia marcescens]|uniref:hypothetical protein n=1 Tax=Serratia marcescens TaxID=615 RepID=UPI001CDBCAD3
TEQRFGMKAKSLYTLREHRTKIWDESKKPVYIARTQNKDLGSWTFKIEKVKQGVVYQGAVFEKD